MDLLCDISQYIWKRGRIHWHTVIYIFLNPYRTNDKWSYNKPCMLYILWHCSIHMEKEGEFIETRLYTNMQIFFKSYSYRDQWRYKKLCMLYIYVYYVQNSVFADRYVPEKLLPCCDISRYTWKMGENSLRHGYIHIYIFFLIHNRTETIGITTTEIHNSTF